jgi:hypothetical protein
LHLIKIQGYLLFKQVELLPAVGFSGCDVGLIGQYWSSTRRNAEDVAALFFEDNCIYHPFISFDCELSGVRCVKE